MKNPVQFMREVRQEVSKVTPPTRRETIVTTIMVFIMVTLAAIFFFLADLTFGKLVQIILGLGS